MKLFKLEENDNRKILTKNFERCEIVRMIKAIIFDFGGTLVFTEEALWEAFTYSLQTNEIKPPSKRELFEHIGRGNFKTIEKAIPRDLPNREDAVENCFKTFRKIFPRYFLSYFREVEGTEAVLFRLTNADFRLGIATSLERKELLPIIALFNWRRLFDSIITLDDYTNPRPSPDCVLVAAMSLGVMPNECVYVGDTLDDIEAGKAACAKTIAVLTGAQSKSTLEKGKPDALVENITHVERLLFNTFK
jgi:HAD superfamily hydrolase (TIGR01549 family)